MSDFAQAKFNMIEQQIRPWEVLDPKVLDVFNRIDRDFFVPEELRGLAYADCSLPVLENESMLPPTVEGRLLQALQLKSSDCVLEIGTCYGYLTACLASMTDQVTSIDFNAEATRIAAEKIAQLGIDNVELQTMQSLDDLTLSDRFDAIAVSAGSLTTVPQNLKDALAMGGRLFVVTGRSPVKHACLIQRVKQNEWTTEILFETDIPDLM